MLHGVKDTAIAGAQVSSCVVKMLVSVSGIRTAGLSVGTTVGGEYSLEFHVAQTAPAPYTRLQLTHFPFACPKLRCRPSQGFLALRFVLRSYLYVGPEVAKQSTFEGLNS